MIHVCKASHWVMSNQQQMAGTGNMSWQMWPEASPLKMGLGLLNSQVVT